MSLSIVIMAAGQGTRMKSSMAKVLHEISGKPMLHHIIEESQKISNDISVVTYHQAKEVESSVEASFKNIRFARQDVKKFPGTGGAVMSVTPKHESVLILNGDMPLVEAKELKAFLDKDGDIIVGTALMENPMGYGRVIAQNGSVTAIVEERDASSEQKNIKRINTGVYLLKKSAMERFLPKLNSNNSQKEYYLTDIVHLAYKSGLAVSAIALNEESFQGVNSKIDLSNAEEVMQKRIKNHWMSQGVSMHAPSTIYIESDVTFSGECELENGVTIKGDSHIEKTTLKSHTVIESAVIKNSQIGPMARIRPQTIIIDSHIGNFVEVKKSTLKGVKAGHLSYIGDSKIDEGSNVGAGVITCNYDGIKKYETIVGKNVFIGSDSQLIAPVTIEDNVMIAAGTTVPKGILKSGSLILSRPPIKIFDNFFYKFFGKKS